MKPIEEITGNRKKFQNKNLIGCGEIHVNDHRIVRVKVHRTNAR